MILADASEDAELETRELRCAGIDKALEEIVSKKVTVFDAGTVDACVKIFEGGYQFGD